MGKSYINRIKILGYNLKKKEGEGIGSNVTELRQVQENKRGCDAHE